MFGQRMSPHAQQIIAIVQRLATQHKAFVAAGPGKGNAVTNLVMQQANQELAAVFGDAVVERAEQRRSSRLRMVL